MPSEKPPPTPATPDPPRGISPLPPEPLGYRSPADDRAARKPIPLRTTVTRTLIVVGVLILLLTLLLPTLGRSRETAQRIKCAVNLRQIGQVCQLYANENNGHYPVSLSIAFADSELDLRVAFCPNHAKDVPTTLPSLLLDAHSDYLYLAAGLTTSAPPDIILAYERPGPHGPDGVNVLFADGRAEFLTLPALQKALESSHTQRQLWERRPTGTPP